VPYFLCLFVIKKNINWFQIVTDEAPSRLTSQSLGVSWFYCGQWFRSMSLLSCTTLAPTRLWVRFLWWIMSDREFFLSGFALFFFRLCLLVFVFVLFCGDEDGWWLCSSFEIWSENLESGFPDWRYGFFSSGVVLLAAYVDSTWLCFILMLLERDRCVDVLCSQ